MSAKCRRCEAQMLFVRLDTGRSIPVDPIPDPTGNVAARRDGRGLVGHVVSKDHPVEDGQQLYRPHIAACDPDKPLVTASQRKASLFDVNQPRAEV